MNSRFLLTLFLVCAIVSVNAQNYNIDSGHSSVQIKIQRFGVIDVVGRFKTVEGTMNYNPEDISKFSAQATIAVESYDANNIGGEKAVKSHVFLDAASFPEITFKSSKVVTREGQNFLTGNLTIHGVTKEIEFPFSINGPLLDLPTKKQSIAFLGSTVINRQDYGISFDAKLSSGTHIIGNDVKIDLMILALAK